MADEDKEIRRPILYRPATHQTWLRVRAYANENEMSLSGAVNALVLRALRQIDMESAPRGGPR